MIPGNFPGDPFGSACVCGDFSVHRHGVFHGNEGAFCGDIVEEHLVQRIAFLLPADSDQQNPRPPGECPRPESHPRRAAAFRNGSTAPMSHTGSLPADLRCRMPAHCAPHEPDRISGASPVRCIYSLSFIVSPPKEKALNKNVQGKPKRHKGPLCKKESSRMQTHPRAASTSAEPCGLCAWYLLSSRLYCRLRSFTESCLTARGLYHR